MGDLIRDRYEPLEVSGRGGQGEVLRARDLVHDRTVALKVRLVPEEERRKALLAEARILLNLRPHALVPLVREDFFEGDRYYLVMDWIDGPTLHSLLAERGDPGLPLDEALGYLADVAEALDHLHGHEPPIVHKDVKPANIIVGRAGRSVLVDFGIAADAGASMRGSTGTRGYVAPELIAGAQPSPAADVFGLAATAYAVLTGAPPRAGKRPRWKGIPKERAKAIELALRRGLAFDPTRRPASATELVAAMRAGPVVPNNLPLQLTSFIGRESEVDAVMGALFASRMVTLTGPGGIGKTRLALAAAGEVLVRFPDGVWFVELAPLVDPDRVAQAVASTFGLRETSGATLTDTVADHLAGREVLVLLDNCEHLLAECAKLVELLLRSCPGVRILATSRESLGVSGETIRLVPPLSVPVERGLPVEAVAASEAAALFVDRARLVQPSFSLREDNAASVTRLCTRLDGIPLAIELAAARMGSLSPAEIAERLDDRFRILAGRKGAQTRQHSLRAVVDWSYDLLSESERALFQVLSVFTGGFTLEAAEAIAGALGHDGVAPDLAQLVDKSLVTLDDAGPSFRYAMMETIRAYAEERLSGSERDGEARARHRDWFTELTLRVEPELEGSEQRRWLDILEAEHGNLRAALQWSLEDPSSAEIALRLSAGLWRFWDVRGYLTEGRTWLERALARETDATPQAVAKALRAAGGLAIDQGDYSTARALHERSLGLAREAGDRHVVAAALNGLAIAAGAQSDFEAERTLYLQALEIWRELGHRRGIAVTLGNLGTAAFERGDPAAAREYLEESLAIRRDLGHEQGIAQALNGLALVAGALGETAAERDLFEESLAIWRELGHKRGVAVALLNLGTAALRNQDRARARSLLEESIGILRELGVKWDLAESLHALGDLACVERDPDLAVSRYEEALAIRTGLGDRRGSAECLEALSALAVERGRHADAVSAYAAAHALREAIGAPPAPARRAAIDRDIEVVRSAIGADAFDAGWKRGVALALEEVSALAVVAARGA